TYVVQRAESLMGLFYLGALYCFVRAVESEHPRSWAVMTWLLALLGMATKEAMVTLPVLLLLYDRIFVSHSFPVVWQSRRWFHAGIASTWIVLAWLVLGTHSRGGSAGFDAGVAPLAYARTQVYATVHYVQLAFFPQPLVFDYGRELLGSSPRLALHF